MKVTKELLRNLRSNQPRVNSEEAYRQMEITRMVTAIHMDNASRIVADPEGPYPLCKPTVGNGRVCCRCHQAIQKGLHACQAIPPEERWRIRDESPKTKWIVKFEATRGVTRRPS